MVETIILAGGKSSRFKTNKMESLISGKPVLQKTIESFLNHTNKIVIITGHYNVDYIKEFIKENEIEVVHNELHEQGMFSSVQKGVSRVNGDFLLTPGDYPNINQETINTLINSEGVIRVPTFRGRKGHPIFIDKSLIKELLNEPKESNLKVFRDRHQVTYIEVDDEGILQDIDYQEDLKKLKGKVRIKWILKIT